MGVYSITESAMAGLNIAQAGILTTSQNVAGASVEGFTRRTAKATMNALAPNSLMLNGTSFAVDGFSRQYSTLVNAQLLNQHAKSSYSDTVVSYTQAIDTLVADKTTGLHVVISDFFNAVGMFSANPTSVAQAGAVTTAAKAVENRMSGLINIVNNISTSASSGLEETITEINTILPELAKVNQGIIQTGSGSIVGPSPDLLDERDRLLTRLQQLSGGQSFINKDGTANQNIAGIPTVEGASWSNLISYKDTDGAIRIKVMPTGKNASISQAMDVDVNKLTTTEGRIGALLDLTNSFVPKINQRLDAIAISLTLAANGYTNNSLKVPNSAVDSKGLFYFNDGLESAAGTPVTDQMAKLNLMLQDVRTDQGITYDSEDLSAISNQDFTAIYNYIGSESNLGFNAKDLISIAPSQATDYYPSDVDGEQLIPSGNAIKLEKLTPVFVNAVSSLIGDVGSQVSTWRNQQKADTAVLQNLNDQRESVSGVNLDEEAANLLKYQQLYTASTKVLQAGNQMFNSLLAIMN
jgi:flagellar hook-associated protein 1 FlgK